MAVPRLTAGHLAVLALALAFVAGCAETFRNLPSPSASVTTEGTRAGVKVPALVGLTRAEAVERVLKLGLHVDVLALGDREDLRDRVARQAPPPGTRVARGSSVIVAAWCEPAPCPSPPAGRTVYDPCSCATRT